MRIKHRICYKCGRPIRDYCKPSSCRKILHCACAMTDPKLAEIRKAEKKKIKEIFKN